MDERGPVIEERRLVRDSAKEVQKKPMREGEGGHSQSGAGKLFNDLQNTNHRKKDPGKPINVDSQMLISVRDMMIG